LSCIETVSTRTDRITSGCQVQESQRVAMGDSNYRLHFYQGKKNEIQHHSYICNACSQLSKQVWNSLLTTWNKLDDIISLMTLSNKVWYSHDMYRTCWNNLATSLIISTRLLQVVNNLYQTCWQLGTSSANTTCWLQDVRFLRVSKHSDCI
jgi:hypothetical protein